MFVDENFVSASGIILSRELSGENNLWLKLFLKGIGIINVTSRKASGDTEPLTWGVFSLKKKSKGKNYSVNEIEITDDMFSLRMNRSSIMVSMNWVNLIVKFLINEHSDDELLANLFWNMKLLSRLNLDISQDVCNWRFIWKWLEIWGLSPDFVKFHVSKAFSDDEIILLAKILNNDINEIVALFSKPFIFNNIRENIFKVAAKCALKFLYQK